VKGDEVASAERWRLLKALYKQAAALSSADREALLRCAGESHAELTIEVRRLLSVSEPAAADVPAPLAPGSPAGEVELAAELTRLIRCMEILRRIRLDRLRARMEGPPRES
jgi:hypothetical protein